MSTQNFQDRLSRIQAEAGDVPGGQSQPTKTQHTKRKLDRRTLIAASVLIGCGVTMLRKANEHYDALKAADQAGLLAFLALGGAAALIAAFWLFMRATFKAQSGQETPADTAPPPGAARIICSLIGLMIGVVACGQMFVASAARHVPTELAQKVAQGGTAMAVILLAIALFLGFIGLFWRRSAMERIPVYFLFGGMLTYAGMRIGGVNLLTSEAFVAALL
ncbi:MAG: hypothetical protein AB8B82_15045 [Roseovarius sp.]